MRRRVRKYTAFAGSMMLLAAGSPILGSFPEAGLAIADSTVVGDVILVGVVSTRAETVTGRVFARLLTERGPIDATADVVVTESQKAFVHLNAGARIVGVIQLGVVVDDGSPF